MKTENIMKNLSEDVIISKFGEYNYHHETGFKLDLVIFWVRDTVAIFKKETGLLIDSDKIDISNINRIDIVVGGDHGQGTFRFPMKILYRDIKEYDPCVTYYTRRIMV